MPRSVFRLLACLAVVAAPASLDSSDRAATESITVHPAGPRSGETGARFFNIEGKNNDRYAAFGVLDFTLASPDAEKTTGLALALTQSIARFSKSGTVRVYLSADVTSAPERLKFLGENGLGDQLAPLFALGESAFEKRETGQTDRMPLQLDEKARAALRRSAQRGRVRLVVAPADLDVAATYFGVGHDNPEYRPRLTVETTP